MKDAIGLSAMGDDGFRPVEVVPEPVHDVARELARSGYRVYRAADSFEAALANQVIERALAMGRKAAPNEWYGILVGRLYRDERGCHVVVLGLVPDPAAFTGTGYVETTHESEFRTRALARLVFPDAVILGWIHGHVGYGARYSATDRKNQATWTQSHAIGIVVDPFHQMELAVYRGPSAELLAEVAGQSPDKPRAPIPPATRESSIEGTSAAKPLAMRAPSIKRRKVVLVGSMLAMLGPFVAVAYFAWRVRTLEARVREAESAQERMGLEIGKIESWVQATEAEQARMAVEIGISLDTLSLNAHEDDGTEASPIVAPPSDPHRPPKH